MFTLLFIVITLIFNGIASGSDKPNIIVFIADDLGFGDVGYNGDHQIATPNIDALAADGIILNNYYTASVCTPSRGAFLSGVHPIQSGTQHYVILTAEPRGFPLNITFLTNHLKKYNYQNHAVGKWHLGFHEKAYTPTFRGFDSHVGYWTGAADYYDHTAVEDTQSWGLDFRHNLDLITNATGIYSTDYFTERCVELINNHNTSNPLFLYMAYQNVHFANHYKPLQAPLELIKKFSNIKNEYRQTFAAMLLAMDISIGNIFKTLHKREMLQNSIVIFTSDNGGPPLGSHAGVSSNWPLRGIKATLWEGGVRVPAFIWSPLLNRSGYVSNALMHISDWFPTLLEAVSGKSFKSKEVYGKSMWKTLSNDLPSARDEVLLNIDPIWNVSALRVGRWKLVQGLVFPNFSGWFPPFTEFHKPTESFESKTREILKEMKRNPNFTILKDTKINCGEKPTNASSNCKPDVENCLFDIVADPCEYNNVAHIYPEIARNLWMKIVEYNKTAIAPGNKPLDPCSWPPLHQYSWSNWNDDRLCP